MGARNLTVLLQGKHIGTLSSSDGETTEFRLLESYKSAYPRPILGQRFLDDLDKVWRTRGRVPEWFSNLLPEGALREFLANRAGVLPSRERLLLSRFGEDLPGAVQIISEEREFEEKTDSDESTVIGEPDGAWHFSLAGVQLKFSARNDGRRLTIPVSGLGGDWIVKLPDSRYPDVPRNEYATMLWARASGINIPDIQLVDTSEITGLPSEVQLLQGRTAYAIRRFDRTEAGQRIHFEDFAQILGLYPEQKYAKFNYETIARVVHVLSGKSGLHEFIRRLVFVMASGNGDAHHKNWSLIYPDGVAARMSPAYDLVSTIQYLPADQLALNFAGSKRWSDVSIDGFRRMARKLGLAERDIADPVDEAIEVVLDAWAHSKSDFGYDVEAQNRINDHMATVPLLNNPAGV